MELNFSKKEKTAGVFTICIAILLISTVVMLGRGKELFKKFIPYYTTFNESYNLQRGAAVKLFKTDIGRVKEIKLIDDIVEVKLIILEDYASRIRKDTYATVESPTLIGSEYISIKPGNRNSPLIPKNGIIPSKDKKSLEDLMSEFQVEKTAKMFVAAIQDLSELMQVFRDPQGPLFRILDDIKKTTSNIAAITHDVQAGKGTVGAILKTNTLIDMMHENLGKVGNILDHIAEVSTKTPGVMNQVEEILDNVAKASARAPAAMEQVQDNLGTIRKAGGGIVENVNQIKKILEDVEENLRTFKVILKNVEESSFDMPQITESTREGINEIRDSIDNINKIAESLKKNFLIRPNLPPEPVGKTTDAGLRE